MTKQEKTEMLRSFARDFVEIMEKQEHEPADVKADLEIGEMSLLGWIDNWLATREVAVVTIATLIDAGKLVEVREPPSEAAMRWPREFLLAFVQVYHERFDLSSMKADLEAAEDTGVLEWIAGWLIRCGLTIAPIEDVEDAKGMRALVVSKNVATFIENFGDELDDLRGHARALGLMLGGARIATHSEVECFVEDRDTLPRFVVRPSNVHAEIRLSFDADHNLADVEVHERE